MSLRSMTGYGRGEVSSAGLRVVVEISSVNRRQLDIQTRLPRTLALLESRLQKEIAAALSRGRITVEITADWADAARESSVQVDEALAASVLRAARRAARKLNLPEHFDASLLLDFPGVISFRQPAEDSKRVWPVLRKALQQALKELIRTRSEEGQRLENDLRKRLRLVEREVKKIAARAPGVAERYQKKLLKRIRRTGLEAALKDERLLREVALFADRSDIQEELTRLFSHFRQSEKLMRSREPAGRPLDFITQEMLRECNTIGAKANDAIIARHVVACKSELERFREQVQNIE